MKRLAVGSLVFVLAFFPNLLRAEGDKDLSKSCEKVSRLMPLSDNPAKNLSDLVYYQMGWSRKAPASLSIQFVNLGYGEHKLKFAVKDAVTKRMILLDTARRSNFGAETLNADSKGAIWSGPAVNLKDGFSVIVWEDDGDAVVKNPISINDLK